MDDSHYGVQQYPMYFLLLALIILVFLSAFFSACEMAFSSLNRIKLKNLAVKSKRARLALKMLDIFDKILSTVLIGNNVVAILSASLATAFFISLFGATGVSIAASVMTVVLLVFGDITPKTLAKESPELSALRMAPLLRFFVWVFSPLSFLSAKWKILIMKIFPVKADRSTTEDELLTFVGEVRQEGGININEEQMIRQVIDFDEVKVSSIITSRVDVEAVSQADTIEEIDRKFSETGFSRLPVFKDTIDNITGIILLKDFYLEVMKGKKTPAEIVKPVVFVPKTIKIAKLLSTLQEKKSYMAIIIDEHGGTLGIVTIEDIVEELVGEIWDEHDEVVESVKKTGNGSYRVLGAVNFADMLKAVNNDLFDTAEIPNTTIANWVMENLGRLPRAGEKLTWKNIIVIVSRVKRHRVLEVEVKIMKTETADDSGTSSQSSIAR